MTSSVATLPTLSGTGLISGKPCQVAVAPLPAGSGIHFVYDGFTLPAEASWVAHATNGITLHREGVTLSIIEHFLAACAMTGHHDLEVHVSGAPELPLLDGSALPWVRFLTAHLPSSPREVPAWHLEAPVYYCDPEQPQIQLIALPSSALSITYTVHFPHPDLACRALAWTPEAGELVDAVAPARTFGMVRDLPKLQARGLARGVTLENTLGLKDDGGYTSTLRLPDEPIRHKILDFIGDMMLHGIAIPHVQARFCLFFGGHQSHLAFGSLLRHALVPSRANA